MSSSRGTEYKVFWLWSRVWLFPIHIPSIGIISLINLRALYQHSSMFSIFCIHMHNANSCACPTCTYRKFGSEMFCVHNRYHTGSLPIKICVHEWKISFNITFQVKISLTAYSRWQLHTHFLINLPKSVIMVVGYHGWLDFLLT